MCGWPLPACSWWVFSCHTSPSADRASGISTGLLLMFILPSFPPYTPEALDSRLIAVALGTA